MNTNTTYNFSTGNNPRILYTTTQSASSDVFVRPLHLHGNCTELLYVKRGYGEYTVDGYHYNIRPKDFLLYNKGLLHEVRSTSQKEIETLCIGISNLKLNTLPEGHLTKPEDGFVRTSENKPELETLMTTIFSIMDENPSYKRAVTESLLRSVILMAVNLPGDERCELLEKEALLSRRITQYIDKNFSKDIDLSNIAAACNVSPYYAAHVFKKETGRSPIQYLIIRRIGEAQNLLISTDLSAQEIACRVGYDNNTHFNAIFKKKVGIPPIRYRNHFLKNLRGIRTQ